MNEIKVIIVFEEHFKNLTLIEFDNKKNIFKKYFNMAHSNETIKRWRKLINTFQMAEYKKEKIWTFLNNDITKEEFEYFVSTTLEKKKSK